MLSTIGARFKSRMKKRDAVRRPKADQADSKATWLQRLFGRLNLAQTFALVGVLFSVPLVLLLVYLVRQKDSFGTWYSTQATVLSLKALLQSVRSGAENTNATVTITPIGVSGVTAIQIPVTLLMVEQVHRVYLPLVKR